MIFTNSQAKPRIAASALALMVVAGMTFAAPAVAAPGNLTLVSTSDTGVKGNFPSGP